MNAQIIIRCVGRRVRAEKGKQNGALGVHSSRALHIRVRLKVALERLRDGSNRACLLLFRGAAFSGLPNSSAETGRAFGIMEHSSCAASIRAMHSEAYHVVISPFARRNDRAAKIRFHTIPRERLNLDSKACKSQLCVRDYVYRLKARSC